MYEDNSDVKQRLIEIGRKEFLEHGYLKARCRRRSGKMLAIPTNHY